MTGATERLSPPRQHPRNGLYERLTAKLSALRLSRLARSVRRQKLTYLSDGKLVRLENALQDAALADGAFVEFGVALGGSAILIAHAARAAGKPFFGFDVFRLIPPPISDKDDARSKERYEVIANGQAKGIGGDVYYGYRNDLYADVVEAFRRNGLAADGRTVSLVKGLFEETWPQTNIRSIAFCHIDCDWYDPVKFCLAQVAQRLSPRGVILLDDYHDYGGCARATDEFLKDNPGFALHDGPNVILRRTGEAKPH